MEDNETVAVQQPLRKESQEGIFYKSYPDRWWVLASVSMIQFANFGHWIAFGAVTKVTAVFYDQLGDRIDLIVLCSYAMFMPTLLVSSVMLFGRRLRKTLFLTAFLTSTGQVTSNSCGMITFN